MELCKFSIQICPEPPLRSFFLWKYGFTMDPYWPFRSNTSVDYLRSAIGTTSGGIRKLWELSTSGFEELGYLGSEVSVGVREETVLNPEELKVTLMDTLAVGRCLLVNYTKPVRKGAAVSLRFDPAPDAVEFSARFLDDYDMAAASLGGFYSRYIGPDTC